MPASRFDFIDRKLPELGAIAGAGYFLGLRIRGASPLMAFHTYPQAWIDEYMQKGYMLRDPVTTWAMTVGGTVRWNALPDPFGIFRKARAFGLRHGASVAHGAIGGLSICSAARSDRAFTTAEIERMREIVVALHDIVALPSCLTDAQKALLGAVEHGRPMAEVAGALGLSPAAADRELHRLCEELVAHGPSEAVRRARDYRLL